MHPGPMNRGVEIAAEVADRPNVVVVDQVRNGVAVRMAVLFLLLGSGRGSRRRHRRAGRGDGRTRPERDVAGSRRAGHQGRRPSSTRRASAGPTSRSTAAASWPSSRTSTCRRRRGARRRRLRRRARPGRPPHPPARARPGGGRDDRDRHAGRGARRLHRRRGHAQHRPGHRLAPRWSTRCTTGPRRALCEVHPRRPSPSGGAGEQLAPMAEMADLGVRLFTDDGNGVQDDRLMRRAMEYASAGPRASDRLAQHCEVDAPGRRRLHARGRVVGQARHPGHPGRGRGADGHPRPRAGPADRRPRPLPAPVDGRVGRAGAGGQGRRAGRSPPRPPPTTSP